MKATKMNDHIQSPCPNKDLCGSCGWSHIPYEKQLKQKLSDINGSFKLKNLDIVCPEIMASPVTEHYRNRMDFVIDFEGRVGLRQKGKWWSVIDNHPCFLADKNIEQLFYSVRTWSQNAGLTYFDRKAHTGLLRYAVIRSSSLHQTMLTIVTSAPKDPEEEKQMEYALQELLNDVSPQLTTLIWSINHTITDVSFGDELRIVHGEGIITEEINGVQYRITPNAFFQTNPNGAAVLQQTVLDYAGDLTHSTVMDLYCGSGFFALAFAKQHAQRVKRVIGIESIQEAIVDAKANAALNQVEVDFLVAKTEEYNWMDAKPDLLILDPPRSGMHDRALSDVIHARPQHIIYVSCNYKHFAREMQHLSELYTVEQMKAIDMFPHTPHVELVTHLGTVAK